MRRASVLIGMFLLLSGAAFAQVENKDKTAPAPAPPEGTTWRSIIGEGPKTINSLKVDLIMDVGFSVNNSSDSSQQGVGGTANFPNGTPGDTGFNFSSMWLLTHRDMKANLLPRVTPLPGPTPKQFSWGFEADMVYGRDCQPGRMAGFDAHWSVNEPGASFPALAAANRQSFLCTPNLYLQAYLPVFKGVAITAGRYGDGVGFEIPVSPSNGPNFFYSHTYAMYSETWQVLGVLASANLVRSDRHGYLLAEFGVNNGEQTAVSPTGNSMGSFEGALRWASPHMSTSVAYAFRAGNGNVKTNALGVPVDTTDFGALYTVLSPAGQMRQRHSVVATHRFEKHWSTQAEFVYFKQAGDRQTGTVWAFGGPHYSGSNAAGANGRVIYEFNSRLAAGFRLETFHASDGFFLLPLNLYTTKGIPAVSKGYFNDFTLGVNYRPVKYIRIRPELRHDWNCSGAFGTGNASVQNGSRNPLKSQLSWNMDILFYF